MRVTLDSNIILSIALFNSHTCKELVEKVISQYTLVMNNFNLCETEWTTERDFYKLRWAMKQYLNNMTYEYYSVDKKQINKQQLNIRDKSDHNILGAAIASKCDVLVTGDKDYFEMKYDNIEILTPRQFLEKY